MLLEQHALELAASIERDKTRLEGYKEQLRQKARVLGMYPYRVAIPSLGVLTVHAPKDGLAARVSFDIDPV